MITEKWAHLDAAMVASSRKTIKELFAEDPDRAGKFTLEKLEFEFRNMIENGECDKLREKMRASTARRALFDKPKA